MSGGFRNRLLHRCRAAGIAVSDVHVDQLESYYALLERWNRKINLTSLPLERFPDATLDRLLVEPLIAASQVGDAAATWIDVGSGGGSPAIPLKIVRPALRLTMVESRLKRAAFLREAVRALELADVQVRDERIEQVAEADPAARVDLVSVRAVRVDVRFLTAVASLLALDGRVVLFAGSREGLGSRSQQRHAMATAGLAFESEVPLPGEGRLMILRKCST